MRSTMMKGQTARLTREQVREAAVQRSIAEELRARLGAGCDVVAGSRELARRAGGR